MFTEEPRTPTHLWLDAKIRGLSASNIAVYVVHKGEKMSGLVLMKINSTLGECRLLTQQRNLDGVMEWVNVYQEDIVGEKKADDYINRSINRDPDLWVVEVEDREMDSLFLTE